MSEITKLYENAGVKPMVRDNAIGRGYYIEHQTIEEYPQFTAEKQLELIKWLSRRYIEVSNYDAENGRMYNIKPTVGDFATSFNYDFSECIAGCINQLWQHLTEEEKQQVKGILE